MYRGQTSSCPSCGSALAGLPSTLPVSGCHTCGGMWLGPEASVHIMRGLGDALEQDVAALSEETARRSLVPSVDSGVRSCPTCSLVMARLVVGEVTVDSCATHGTWFDRDEVGHVARVCRRLRAEQHPGPVMSAVRAVTDVVDRVVMGPFVALEQVVDAWMTSGDDRRR